MGNLMTEMKSAKIEADKNLAIQSDLEPVPVLKILTKPWSMPRANKASNNSFGLLRVKFYFVLNNLFPNKTVGPKISLNTHVWIKLKPFNKFRTTQITKYKP